MLLSRILVALVLKSEADDHAFRQLAGQTVQAVVSAAGIEAAREAIRKSHPQLVVCDAEIEEGRCWKELLEDAKAADVVLIAVSAHPDTTLWAEALNLGAFDVLALPFDREELDRVVSSAIRHAFHSHARSQAAMG